MAALAALASSIGLSACKDKESLVVVTMTADYPDTTLASASISVGSHAVTFNLDQGIPYGGVSFGVYVPSGITGPQTINVVASPATAGDCDGLAGTGHVNITAAGETYGPITVNLIPSTTACPIGGHTGTGGSGTGGHGTGGTGTGGSGGGITSCSEYDHGDTGQCADGIGTCTGDYHMYGAAFSPTNSGLAVTSGTDGRVKVWTVSNGSMAPEGHEVKNGSGFNVIAFSPDGTLLAIGVIGGVQLVSTTTWTPVRTLTVAGTVYGVGFSPDGTQVVTVDADETSTASTLPGHLYVHSVTSATPLSSVAVTDPWALAVSPAASGSSVPVAVTTSDGTALVYNLSALGFSSPTTLNVDAGQEITYTAQFSPSGALLAAGGESGILSFWAAPFAGSPQAPTINVDSAVVASATVSVVAFSPSGTELAIGGGASGSVTTYVTATRARIGAEQDTSSGSDVLSLGYSPDAQYIIGGEHNCGCVFLCKH